MSARHVLSFALAAAAALVSFPSFAQRAPPPEPASPADAAPLPPPAPPPPAETEGSAERDVAEAPRPVHRPFVMSSFIGYGTGSLSTGLGLRLAYVSRSRVYIGGLFQYHFGESSEQGSGGFTTTKSVTYFLHQFELGYSGKVGPVEIRPYFAMGPAFGFTAREGYQSAFGARFLIVGWASTPFVAKGKGERGAPNANMLPTNLIMMKGLDVLGCPTVIATVNDPSLRPPRLAAILGWASEGKLRPVVSARFAIDDFATALRAKWSGEVVGGAVLLP